MSATKRSLVVHAYSAAVASRPTERLLRAPLCHIIYTLFLVSWRMVATHACPFFATPGGQVGMPCILHSMPFFRPPPPPPRRAGRCTYEGRKGLQIIDVMQRPVRAR